MDRFICPLLTNFPICSVLSLGMQWSQGDSGLKCCHISALCMQQLVVCPVACQNFFNLFARNPPFPAHFPWDILDLVPSSRLSKGINHKQVWIAALRSNLDSIRLLRTTNCAAGTQTWECTIWGRGRGGGRLVLSGGPLQYTHWSGLWTQNEATIRRRACSSTKRCIRLQAAEFQFAVRKLGGKSGKKEKSINNCNLIAIFPPKA